MKLFTKATNLGYRIFLFRVRTLYLFLLGHPVKSREHTAIKESNQT